jgi:hypothetical protein
VGDRTYGSTGDLARRLGLDRPFLHAWRLVWPDPVTGERRAVEEPLPSELREALARAGLADSLATRRRAV